MTLTTTGTKEWADSNENFCDGCSNDCGYCYAKANAKRFRPESYKTWSTMKIKQREVDKGYRKRKGRIMFPTSHDITLEVLKSALRVLTKMLTAGNEVLITTKPDPTVIRTLCNRLREFIPQIQFRFTITSVWEPTSKKWEPGAPPPNERLKALKWAFNEGYKTSISIEPYLDAIDLVPHLICITQDWVTDTIWIGPMNKKHLQTLGKAHLWDESKWGIPAMRELYDLISDEGDEIQSEKIRLKDSFRNALKVEP